jgi:hypothetical protein
VLRLPAQMRRQLAPHRLAVFRVVARQLDPLAARAQRLGGVLPHQLLRARRQEQVVARQVPVPQALVGALHRELVALLRAAQRFFGALLFVDVAHRAGPANRLAVGAGHRAAAHAHPAVLAIGMQHAVFVFAHRGVAIDAALRFGGMERQVVGVGAQQLHPLGHRVEGLVRWRTDDAQRAL